MVVIQHEMLADAEKCLGVDQQIDHDAVVVIDLRQMIYTRRQDADIPLPQQCGRALDRIGAASGKLVHKFHEPVIVVVVGDKTLMPVGDDVAVIPQQCLRREIVRYIVDICRQRRHGMVDTVFAVVFLPEVQLPLGVGIEQMDHILLRHEIAPFRQMNMTMEKV